MNILTPIQCGKVIWRRWIYSSATPHQGWERWFYADAPDGKPGMRMSLIGYGLSIRN
jgi:hypothetical protein